MPRACACFIAKANSIFLSLVLSPALSQSLSLCEFVGICLLVCACVSICVRACMLGCLRVFVCSCLLVCPLASLPARLLAWSLCLCRFMPESSDERFFRSCRLPRVYLKALGSRKDTWMRILQKKEQSQSFSATMCTICSGRQARQN